VPLCKTIVLSTCSGSSVELRYWERWSAEQPPLPMVYLPIGWSVHFWRRRHEGIEDLAPRQALKNIDWVRATCQRHPHADPLHNHGAQARTDVLLDSKTRQPPICARKLGLACARQTSARLAKQHSLCQSACVSLGAWYIVIGTTKPLLRSCNYAALLNVHAIASCSQTRFSQK